MKLDNYHRSIALAGRNSNAVSEDTGQNRVTNKETWSELIQTRKKVNESIPPLYPLNVDPNSWDGVYAFYICCMFCVQSRWYRHGRSWDSNLGILRHSLPQTLCQSNYLHDPTSLFSLPWLHQFTIVGIPHDNWRMVAIPGFFIRTWERSSVLERCRSSQQIQEKVDDTRECEYGLSEVVLHTWSLTKLLPPFPCHKFNYSIPQTDQFSNDF